MNQMKIGHGYDVHRLVEGRDLILGGVKIPHTLGLLGHSDADVLTHAVMDAVLGALGEGDIGRHFPDTDDKYKGIDSLLLAKEVALLMQKKGYALSNLDVTVLAQKPKIAPYLAKMRENLAQIFDCEEINIKATTEEGLGFTGAQEGIAVHAVCLLVKIERAAH
jgi:2-C-methyl-D-erythritol 2,4-cyclodiphosphate synthase